MNTIKFFDCDREIEAVTSLNDLLVLFINGKTVNFSLKNFTKFDPITKVYKFIYNNRTLHLLYSKEYFTD